MILKTLNKAVAVNETTNCEKKEQGRFHQMGGTTTPIISDGRKNKGYLLGLPLPVKYKVSINHCLKHRIGRRKERTISTPVVQFTSRVPLGMLILVKSLTLVTWRQS